MLLALSPGGVRREWASAATVTLKQEGPAALLLTSCCSTSGSDVQKQKVTHGPVMALG